jgi:hypothetical protein
VIHTIEAAEDEIGEFAFYSNEHATADGDGAVSFDASLPPSDPHHYSNPTARSMVAALNRDALRTVGIGGRSPPQSPAWANGSFGSTSDHASKRKVSVPGTVASTVCPGVCSS